VLDCFAEARRPLGNSDVAAATGIPRPSVTRLIATLVSMGHLRPAAQAERWELAAGVVRLAQAFLGTLDIRSFARPHVVALAEDVGASSLLGIRDGPEMLVVEAARSRSAMVFMGADVGTRMSLVTSALGRAWLAGVDSSVRDAVRMQLAKPGRSTSARELSSMDAELMRSRDLGYCVSLGEWHPNINAVAVPIRTPSGEVIVLNCGSPAFVLPAERLTKVVVPRILAAADAIAQDIGGVAGKALTNVDTARPQVAASAQASAKAGPKGRLRKNETSFTTE
jgi:IclR family transcriptional regulator, positive regulator for flagellar biogenesis